MGLARSTARVLNRLGHDAVHLRDLGLDRAEDAAVVALSENRVLLTHDLDLGRIVALGRGRVPTVVTFRLSDMRPTEVNRWLETLIERFGTDLEAGALVTVGDRGIRVRRLPISSPGRGPG